MQLTDTDLQIIEALRKDARQTNKAMATSIGVSEETIRRRVHTMVESDVLQFHVNVSAEALGMPVSALINVEVHPSSPDNILEDYPSVHVKRVHDTVEGHQVYEIAARDLEAAGAAVSHLRMNPDVIDATITFLHTTGDHRI